MAGVWTSNTKVVGSILSLNSQIPYGNKTTFHLCYKPNINKPAKPVTYITIKTPAKLYMNSLTRQYDIVIVGSKLLKFDFVLFCFLLNEAIKTSYNQFHSLGGKTSNENHNILTTILPHIIFTWVQRPIRCFLNILKWHCQLPQSVCTQAWTNNIYIV